MFTSKKYMEQIISKYNLADYIIEVIKNNQDDIEKNAKSKKNFMARISLFCLVFP